eukprot:scaffold3559_cov284-Chaetoceros_neogracile.AAC.2
MDHNNHDIMRRRKTPASSGFRQQLLQNDDQHLESGQPAYYNNTTTSSSAQSQGIVNSSYNPPSAHNDNNNPPTKDNFWDNPSSLQQQQNLLYLSSPQSVSLRRTIVTQTPARTAPTLNSIHDSLQQSQFRNPAEDTGSKSLFSYGCMCCQCVRTTEIGVVETCGKYQTLLDPGFYCLPWPISDISGRLSLRINQLEIMCETKTIDSVFCTLALAVPFRIITERAYDAYYRLMDPRRQIESHVFDVVRSTVPKMTLDQVFESKKTIADAVSRQLEVVMADYGYEIFKTLVIDIRPDESVRQAMNEMNASKRLKAAMVYIAEGEKIKIIKDAEAHAECLYLQGVGISGQQKALVQEIKSSFQTGDNVNNNQVMSLLLINQYNDMMTTVSKDGASLIMKTGPGQVGSLTNQVGAYHG